VLGALITFLIGCLVLVVVIYVLHLVIDMLTLPPQVRQIGLVIVGLIGFLVVVYLAFGAMAWPAAGPHPVP
jgi:Na+/phosphate symporter